MKAYDLPQVDGLTVEEAEDALEVLWADVLGDPAHPYVAVAHPQHRRFVAAVTALYAARNPPADLGPPLTGAEQAEIKAEIKRLEATPGYASGALRQQSLPAHGRLLAKIQALYRRLAEGRQAAERAAAQDTEIDPAEAAERVAEAELEAAVERVRRAEQDAATDMAEETEGENEDDDDLL